jgi:hypothetical protein
MESGAVHLNDKQFVVEPIVVIHVVIWIWIWWIWVAIVDEDEQRVLRVVVQRTTQPRHCG